MWYLEVLEASRTDKEYRKAKGLLESYPQKDLTYALRHTEMGPTHVTGIGRGRYHRWEWLIEEILAWIDYTRAAEAHVEACEERRAVAEEQRRLLIGARKGRSKGITSVLNTAARDMRREDREARRQLREEIEAHIQRLAK